MLNLKTKGCVKIRFGTVLFYFPWDREVRIGQAHQNLGNRAMVSFRLILSAVGTTLFKAQGGMRAKPEMKPWVHTDKSGMSSVGAALPTHALGFIRSVVPLLWGSKCIDYYYPGLAPWAMQEYRPKGLFCDTFKINVSTSYSFQ